MGTASLRYPCCGRSPGCCVLTDVMSRQSSCHEGGAAVYSRWAVTGSGAAGTMQKPVCYMRCGVAASAPEAQPSMAWHAMPIGNDAQRMWPRLHPEVREGLSLGPSATPGVAGRFSCQSGQHSYLSLATQVGLTKSRDQQSIDALSDCLGFGLCVCVYLFVSVVLQRVPPSVAAVQLLRRKP